MILATGALAAAVWLSTAALAVAVGARTTEKTFRYSAERTGREILYVPVPEDIKLKAKSYIDVAVEKGLGKALSGVLIAIPSLALAGLSITGASTHPRACRAGPRGRPAPRLSQGSEVVRHEPGPVV